MKMNTQLERWLKEHPRTGGTSDGIEYLGLDPTKLANQIGQTNRNIIGNSVSSLLSEIRELRAKLAQQDKEAK